jgi:hypothetical protein
MGHSRGHNFSGRHILFGRFSKYYVTQTTPGALPADPSFALNSGINIALHYTEVFSPTFVYNFTGGYNRATIPFGNTPLGKDFNTAVGDNIGVPVALGFLPSSQTLNGSRFNSPSYVSYDLANPDDAYQFNNEFHKVAGAHTLSFGLTFCAGGTMWEYKEPRALRIRRKPPVCRASLPPANRSPAFWSGCKPPVTMDSAYRKARTEISISATRATTGRSRQS